MKNNSRLVTIIFLSFILIAPMAFVVIPTAKAFSLQSFTISPDPSAVALLVGHSYDFTLTATLPGGSGSNGVDVYVLPQAGPVGTTGVTISYTDIGYGIYPLLIPPNGNSASVKMTITIPSDATPGPLPLTVTAYDNPGSGGTIIGSFTATLHVDQISLTVQTSGLSSPTNVYIGGSKVGTASDGAPYSVWYNLDPSTGTVTIGAIGVDNTVYGSAQYFFSGWADSTSNPHPAITTGDSVTLTAYYVTKSSQITITSNPTGSNFISVDNTVYSSPHTFTWAVGSTHTLQALSPVAGTSGTQYVYYNWSDSGAQSHSYTVASTTPATVTANYRTQYSVAFAVNPAGAGSTNPSDGTSVWSGIGALPISAVANPGYHFDHWSSSTGSITFTDSTLASTTATVNGPGTLTANFEFNPVTHFAVEAPSPVTAGSSFQVKVTALDAGGNTIAGYTGTVQITSSDSQAVLPSAAQLTNGVGYFTVTLKTAGSQSITASDQADFTITGSTNVMVNADTSSIVLVVDAPSSATAGVPFTFTVTAEDNYGNTITSYSGTIHFTSTSSGTLPADSTLSSGTGSFSANLTSTGYKTITATTVGLPSISGTSGPILVSPGTGSYTFTITGYPSSVNAGDNFGSNVVVTVYDQYGNVKTDYTGSVYFTSTDAKATLPYTSASMYTFTSSDEGTHTFSGSGFTLYTAGTQTITVTDGSVSEQSSGITVNHASDGASYFVVDTPVTTNAGSTIPVTVTAKDIYGNTVTDYSGTVTFTSTDTKANLPNDSVLNSGVGNFIAYFETAGAQTITATDTADNSITGTSSLVVVGPALSGASAFVVSAQTSAAAGSAFTVTVTAIDVYGNLVPSYAGTVHLSSSDAQWSASADSTLTDGVGTFTVTLRTAGSQVITATDTEDSLIAGSTNVLVTVDASSATNFVVTAPSFTDAGQSFSVTVTAKDQFGNIVTGYTGTVHFSSSDAGSKVSLPADYTFVAEDAGAHTFTGVILVTSGSQTITAQDTANEISGSTQIQVNVPADSAVHFDVSSPSSATAGDPFIVTVTAKDTFGNTVTGYTGTVHFTSTDNSAILPSDYTFQASDSGSKAFDGVILITEGVQTITATDTVTSSITGTTPGITVAGNPDYPKTIVVSPPSASINAGDSQAFTAELFDIYGNSLGDVTNQVTWIIDVGAGGSWDQATGTYTSAKASPDGSPWTVTATLNDISGYASLTVTHATDVAYLDHITASLDKTTVAAPNTVTGTAIAYDTFGNSWDVSTTAEWNIPGGNDGGSWAQNVYTSNTAGTYSVQASYEGKTATASLTVTHATDVAYLDYITASVNPTTVAAPSTATGTATAYDTFGNSWDVSTQAAWSIPAGGDGGSWTLNVYTPNTAGTYTIQAVFEGKTATTQLIVTHATDTNYLDHITVSPATSTIDAGDSQSYTATAYDSFGNTWDVTNLASWGISAGAGGSWNGASYTSANQGSWEITATYLGKSATAALTVTHATDIAYLDHITASINPTTVAAPNTATGTAVAYDTFGNSWDVSTQAAWSIPDGNDGGQWASNVYTSHTAGTYTVQALYEGKTATATLTVTHGSEQNYLDHISISPKESTVSAGVSQSYTATAYDTFGNSWTVTAAYTCSDSKVVISDNSAYSNTAGVYTITGTFNGKSDTATLTVVANAQKLDHIVISPKTASINVGSSQSYQVEAFDAYGNSLGSVTSSTTFTAPGTTVAGNTISAPAAATYTVTATYSGKTDTATLIVTNPSSANTLYTFTFIEKGLPQGKTWSATFNGQTKSSTGSTITFNVGAGHYSWSVQNYVSENQEVRYIASQLNGAASITVPTVTSQSITYTPQYKLTIDSPHGSPVGANWYFVGVNANFSISSPDTAGDTRYVFTSWSGNITSTNTNASIVMNAPKTVVANWNTQYYLTVNSTYGNPTGAGWYDAGSQAKFSVNSPVTDSSGTHAFTSWTGTGADSYSGTANSHTVTMNGPVTEAANWELSSSLYSVLLAAIIIFILILIALLLAWRRRRKKKQVENAAVKPEE